MGTSQSDSIKKIANHSNLSIAGQIRTMLDVALTLCISIQEQPFRIIVHHFGKSILKEILAKRKFLFLKNEVPLDS